MSGDEILFASIAEVGAAYRAGTLSPVAVTEKALARIEALNPVLNAFITVTAELARESAHRAETELHAGHDRGSLHGIPVALKDLVDTANIRTTAGSRHWAQRIPTADARIVRHLAAAGAVLVGKTNLLEFAYGIVHPDFGPTWNPWDTTRTAGGSSGGSAAAVAAGMCYAAVGTDTGGSIRIPASYCGVVGFKPTFGAVSLDGIFPLSWSLDHAGPLARTSQDAALLYDVLRGAEPQPLQPAALAGLRLGVLVDHQEGREMEAPVRALFDETCRDLQRAGATLVNITIPHLDLGDAVMMSVIGPEASAIHARMIGARPEAYAPLTRAQIELGFAIPGVVYVRAQQFRRHLTAHFLEAFHRVDALLSPTAPWVAPHEDPAVVGDEGAAEARRTAPYNVTGLPAHSVACGLNPAGLPVGFQIATPPGADRLALAIGAAVEALRPEVLQRLPHLLIRKSSEDLN